ncbi:hypothetical protein CC1G_02542 [Coprinopsis cinerea okayama7|uniref:Fungal lipase-type domain-containing protein n=1 Tax=Coprinopsis cinerea (strain Okayama-7 / 130 / ATCC MYA-4618 / FGSC 9003) TaxID=240176 RepID=A8NBT2_COPC7|nr:hypothetical protein CC1G_02542 [Coprinopsis cinerea okayama7\|eukprot:XP_001832280.2 hypothetical protein CC1G_02542 [Coprinopsis cinerea okayama7\
MSLSARWNRLIEKVQLTEEQRRMYAAERLDNFRWISKLLAAHSPQVLNDTHLVQTHIKEEIEEIGQFAELIYSSIPIQDLLEEIETLSKEDFPLEYHHALRDAALLVSFEGSVAKLPVGIFHRPTHKQLIVSICGTAQIQHIVQDLRFLKVKHPISGNAHSGFWALYTGIADRVKTELKALINFHSPDEIIITGHSMGGAVGYLLLLDILSDQGLLPPSPPAIKLATFGTPRVGDAALVSHFHNTVAEYTSRHGDQSFIEYSVRGYNDGVPTLPPLKLGYRHFAKTPIYATGDQLYFVPEAECEYALFHVESGNERTTPTRFPRGGHNYYNGRELEKMLRRISWLEKANFREEDWEERYRAIVQKHS